MPPLVSTDWLSDALDEPDLRIVDATLLGADTGRDARADYTQRHLPRAVFLDLASMRDTASPLPNTRPDAARLSERLAALGIADGNRVVLYDDSPWHSAARAWWLLDGAGIRVSILDGGLAKWRAEGRPLEPGDVPMAAGGPATFQADEQRWIDLEAMRRAQAAGDVPIVDARSTSRFTGDEPDPHPGTAAGHMPGAISLPYGRLFNEDGTWKRGEALAAAFRGAGVDPTRPFVATCGSGITAAVLAFGAHLLGIRAKVYDGSWAEWGADPTTPKALGPA